MEVVLDLGTVLRTVKVAHAVRRSASTRQMNVPRLPTVLQVMKVKADRIAKISLGSSGSRRPTPPSWPRRATLVG